MSKDRLSTSTKPACDSTALGGQEGFITGFVLLGSLAVRHIPMPRGRLCTPLDTVNTIVNTACQAVVTASRSNSMTETDEDFSPLENQLADTLIALMAATKVHRLRVAQCATSKLARTARLS